MAPQWTSRTGGLSFMLGSLAALLGPSSACIIPDYCILIWSKGQNWCSNMDFARKWPEGHPELAEPILSDELIGPKGCTCVNDTEAAILADKVPADAYEVLVAEAEAAARQNCLTLGVGFANNCMVESGPNAPMLSEPKLHEGQSGPCVGDCEYFKPPPHDYCPHDPDPFACEELVSGGGNDEADEGACPIGAEECPCTVGGACDSNLECVDGMCVPLPDDEEADGESDSGPIFDDAGGAWRQPS